MARGSHPKILDSQYSRSPDLPVKIAREASANRDNLTHNNNNNNNEPEESRSPRARAKFG